MQKNIFLCGTILFVTLVIKWQITAPIRLHGCVVESGPSYTFFMKPICILYTLYRANNNSEDQTAWMRSLVCAFVVRMQLSQVFAQHVPPVMSKCVYSLYCYKRVSNISKKKKTWKHAKNYYALTLIYSNMNIKYPIKTSFQTFIH